MAVMVACHLTGNSRNPPSLCPALFHLTAQRSSVNCSATQVAQEPAPKQALEINQWGRQRATWTTCHLLNRFRPMAAVGIWATMMPLWLMSSSPTWMALWPKTWEQGPSAKPPPHPWMSVPASNLLPESTLLWAHKASPSPGAMASLLWASARPCWLGHWGTHSSWVQARLTSILNWGTPASCTLICSAWAEPAQSLRHPPPPHWHHPPLLPSHLPHHCHPLHQIKLPVQFQVPCHHSCWAPAWRVWPVWLGWFLQASLSLTVSLWPASTQGQCSQGGCQVQLPLLVQLEPASSHSTLQLLLPAPPHLPLPPSPPQHGLKATAPHCWWMVGMLAEPAALTTTTTTMMMWLRWGDSDRWKMFEQTWFNVIINQIGWHPICQDAGFKGPVAEAVRETDKNWKTVKVMTSEPLFYLKCFLCCLHCLGDTVWIEIERRLDTERQIFMLKICRWNLWKNIQREEENENQEDFELPGFCPILALKY